MPIYAKVDSTTGEFHERDCGECGILTISGYFDIDDEEIEVFKSSNSSEGHTIVEISSEEKDKFAEIVVTVERGDKRIEIPPDENIADDVERKSMTVEHKYKVDLSRSTTDLIDRSVIDIPIEAEGIGGKEIIGYQQKPEVIVTEKEREIEVIKRN